MSAPSHIDTARKAMDLMLQYGVDPLPMHYAVWFEYVTENNPELSRELNHIITQNLPLGAEAHKFLYEQYIREAENGRMLDSVAVNTRNLLGEVYRIIADFSGETNSYNNELEKHVEVIAEQCSSLPDVQNIVKEIVASAGQLRQQSQHIHQKLNESQEEVEKLRENLTKITSEASRDHLTGVANRKAFDRQLIELISLSAQDNSDMCLLLLDVDHFKKFNDTFGHLIGDEVLKVVARTLTDCVRGKDFVARYGGEEFAVLLPATPLRGAQVVAETIRKTIAGRELKRKDTGENYGKVTVSIGIAQYSLAGDSDAALIKRADDALYAAKHAGRNQINPPIPA